MGQAPSDNDEGSKEAKRKKTIKNPEKERQKEGEALKTFRDRGSIRGPGSLFFSEPRGLQGPPFFWERGQELEESTKALIVFGISSFMYHAIWSFERTLRGGDPRLRVIFKFLFYVNLMVWFNSVYFLRAYANGQGIESRKDMRDLVLFNLCWFATACLMEIPTWIASLG